MQGKGSNASTDRLLAFHAEGRRRIFAAFPKLFVVLRQFAARPPSRGKTLGPKEMAALKFKGCAHTGPIKTITHPVRLDFMAGRLSPLMSIWPA